MNINAEFILNSLMFGLSLAVDGFVITLVGGVNRPNLSHSRVLVTAAVFALFQAVAPMLGWVCVHTVARQFAAVSRWLNWAAFAVLLMIGLKMILGGGSDGMDEPSKPRRSFGVALILQGMATSVDSLTAGFVNADYNWIAAATFSLIAASVTFCACLSGHMLGRKLGRRDGLQKLGGRLLDRRNGMNKLSIANLANLVGGLILIIIGAEIVL